MSDTISFDSTSPRFGLPLLFAAQSQKEVYVNEALALVDGLIHCAIEGSATTPPSAPADGTAWLVGTGASGDWAGEDGKLACHQAGAWIFVAPCNGMNLLNKANGQFTHYLNGWQSPALVAAPSGGTVIDSQARTAIAALISALQAAAILPSG